MSAAETALWQRPAREVAALLAAGDITPGEALDSAEARVAEVNPSLNALPTLAFAEARARAAQGALPAPLHGLPVPIKDSVATAGIRTTWGSTVFSSHVPARNDAVVDMLEARGALVCAKSNTPEFEAGAHTFNEVFGITRNPWDLARTAGGSSGGAAVAVATGMAWIAQGSDFAASLRNPAGFNGVVGLRPSPGVVPQGPNALPFQSLSVHGPIARDVADCGFALDAMAGAHPADPWARPHAPGAYAAAALRPEAPRRLAASADLGITPVDPSVRAAFGMAVDALARAGAAVEEARPELSEAHAAFGTLRAVQFASAWSHLLAEHRAAIKPDAVWNMEAGLSATGAQIASAERARTALRARLMEFLGTHTALVLPTAIVPPFPATLRYVSECDGIELPDYVRWMANCYAITLAGCPAISVPAGATADGLPFGLQIVAAPHAEARLLSVAAWAEAVLAPRRTTPIDPREPAA